MKKERAKTPQDQNTTADTINTIKQNQTHRNTKRKTISHIITLSDHLRLKFSLHFLGNQTERQRERALWDLYFEKERVKVRVRERLG